MVPAPEQALPTSAKPVRAILCGGFIAGALDITYAIIRGAMAGITPARVLKSVASGLLGRAAFQGGSEIAALGLVLHFFIALGASTVYYVASRRMAVLVDRAWLSGLLFGALVYLVMYRVVVPLSAAPFRTTLRIPDLLVHMFFIGLPIALSVRRYSR
jgi:hypothetical protein